MKYEIDLSSVPRKRIEDATRIKEELGVSVIIRNTEELDAGRQRLVITVDELSLTGQQYCLHNGDTLKITFSATIENILDPHEVIVFKEEKDV